MFVKNSINIKRKVKDKFLIIRKEFAQSDKLCTNIATVNKKMNCIQGNGKIDLNGNGYLNGSYTNGVGICKDEEL